MKRDFDLVGGNQNAKLVPGNANLFNEAQSLFDTGHDTQQEMTCQSADTNINSDAEENCIYISDDRCVDAVTKLQGGSAYISLPTLKISTAAFEILAAGILTMLPHVLGIRLEEIAYSHGIKIETTTARAFARFQFEPEYFQTVEVDELLKRVQLCIDLLKDKHLWNDDKMKRKPVWQTPYLLEQARQVRGQFATRELPCTCTLSGSNVRESIKIGKEFGMPKPPKIENESMCKKGEVKGFHGEFRLMHFVFGSHRKVVDIAFDEAEFREAIIKFSTTDRIVVEAKWEERREDGAVKSMTLTELRLIQEPLFDMPK
nr:hypothetical protein [Rhodoferax sp.]